MKSAGRNGEIFAAPLELPFLKTGERLKSGEIFQLAAVKSGSLIKHAIDSLFRVEWRVSTVESSSSQAGLSLLVLILVHEPEAFEANLG